MGEGSRRSGQTRNVLRIPRQSGARYGVRFGTGASGRRCLDAESVQCERARLRSRTLQRELHGERYLSGLPTDASSRGTTAIHEVIKRVKMPTTTKPPQGST